MSRDDTQIVVETSRGPVTIERSRVVAAKQVPPKPTRRGAPHLAVSVEDLQRVMAHTWGALERERLGDWELRASAGFTQRGNSVVVVGSPGVPLEDAVHQVEKWYAARGLPARLALAGPEGFEPEDDPLGALLLRRGYAAGSRTRNLTAATEAVAAADPGGPEVVVSERPSRSWLDTYARTRRTLPGVTEQVLTGSPSQLFGQVTLPDAPLRLRERSLQRPFTQTQGQEPVREPIALARLGIGAGWAGLGAVWTDPAYRGRGLAAHLTARLARAARAGGTHLVHLQVEDDNDGAIRMYRRLGFQTHSAYVYLSRP